MSDNFTEDIKKLSRRYPMYRPLWNRVLKKIENGDREGAMKTLRSCFNIALCGGNPDIKSDIWKVISDEQKR